MRERMRALARDKVRVSRLENALIAILVLLALVLAVRTGIFQNTLSGLGQGRTLENGAAVGADVSLGGAEPVRLMFSTEKGRFGAEYDRDAVAQWYADGLSYLLEQSLRAMETPAAVTELEWQTMLLEKERWVFYDFLDDLLFSDQLQDGAGRFFVITAAEDRAEAVYYYDPEKRAFFAGQVTEEVPLPPALGVAEPNGAMFAFEDPATAQLLSPYMMVLKDAPVCPVYTAEDPLKELDGGGWEELLGSLEFNANAVSPYTTVTGNVIREGADTLRILNDGTIQFHGTETGEVRYQALSARDTDLRSRAEEILRGVLSSRLGDAAISCQSIRPIGEGQTELLFSYVLQGARVRMPGEGWGARFLCKGNAVTSYTILLRQYTRSTLFSPLLPARQAAAAASAMGRRGSELQVTYQDTGGGQVAAGWTVREPR